MMANHTRDWTRAEDDVLRERYADEGADLLLDELPGRNRKSIVRRARELGVRLSPEAIEAVRSRQARPEIDGATWDEVAREIGVCRQRAIQIADGALAKVRSALAASGYGPEDVDRWA